MANRAKRRERVNLLHRVSGSFLPGQMSALVRTAIDSGVRGTCRPSIAQSRQLQPHWALASG